MFKLGGLSLSEIESSRFSCAKLLPLWKPALCSPLGSWFEDGWLRLESFWEELKSIGSGASSGSVLRRLMLSVCSFCYRDTCLLTGRMVGASTTADASFGFPIDKDLCAFSC